MKTIILNTGDTIEVLDDTPYAVLFFLKPDTIDKALGITSLLTEEALAHVELHDGGTCVDAEDDLKLINMSLTKEGDELFSSTVQLGPKEPQIPQDILDKAAAYDILMGGA